MLKTLEIDGYRPFREIRLELGRLNVLVGANASGKSSLFEFLRFLSESMRDDIPPEIVRGPSGRSLFHLPGPEQFTWRIEVHQEQTWPFEGIGAGLVTYRGTLMGPIGRPRLVEEKVQVVHLAEGLELLKTTEEDGKRRQIQLTEVGPEPQDPIMSARQEVKPQRLGLSLAYDKTFFRLFDLREKISSWRFFDAARIDTDKIRQPSLTEQDPSLAEDGSNLSAVLHYLALEHRERFERIELHLSLIVPGFRGLSIKSRGGPGQVLAFWQEEKNVELSLADVSDGSLRLLCWLVLGFQPNIPTLVTIDEPELGLHPRALASLAGLFTDLAQRTQVILATHSSALLSYFKLEDLVVARRQQGSTIFRRPASSKVLLDLLEEFEDDGDRAAEIEGLHRSDELEQFA